MSDAPLQAERLGGILLHPTSLPGPHGIGDLGPPAEDWVDWLAESGCGVWQVLPLGPTGYGDSPYQCLSAFAGNPLLISLERLVEDGLLEGPDLEALPAGPPERVEYGQVIPARMAALAQAAARFRAGAARSLRPGFEAFCARQAHWLDEFALFAALKEAHGGAPWTRWDPALLRREPGALARARARLRQAAEDRCLWQYLFFRQWQALRARAAGCAVRLMGDLPIFVAHDSADVWAHPEFFRLDAQGQPTAVAGTPPDRFSSTGQRWGNPLYRWDVMQANGYAWWRARFRLLLELADSVRLDHFRGFEAFWEIPAAAPDAAAGRWTPGPGAAFFESLRAALGGLPVVAEDLGEITPAVLALREALDLPGMKILQFGLEGGPDHPYLPHNYARRCAAYSGNHDNDTARGWYESAGEAQRDFARRYLSSDGRAIHWAMLRALWASVAELAIVPLQDVLGLGNEARMNVPSRAEGNWAWRVRREQITPALAASLRELSELYGRNPRARA